MGVSKQAVQKRFVPEGRRPHVDFRAPVHHRAPATCVVAAQNEARAAGNAEIRPEHLVLGLLAEPDGARRPGARRRRASRLETRPAGGDRRAAPARRRAARADPVRRRGQEGAGAHLPRGVAAGTQLRRHRTRAARPAGAGGGHGRARRARRRQAGPWSPRSPLSWRTSDLFRTLRRVCLIEKGWRVSMAARDC